MSKKQTKAQGGVKTFFAQSLVKQLLALVIVVGIFAAGWGFGSGQLSLPTKSSEANKNLPAKLDYRSVDDLYNTLKESYNGKLTEGQLLDGIKHGLAEATNDPYTTYFTANEAETFESDLNNTFSGIGASLGKDSKGNIQVIAPIAGTPADKAGVKAKDLIATINGKSTAGMSVDDAVKNIRGKSGTQVKLQIVRGDQPVELTITRETIQVPSVTYKTLDDNIGYISVTNFANDTPQLISKATSSLKQAGVKGVILDMRNNPGGAVDSAVAVSSEWLPSGKLIMQEKRGSEIMQTYQSTGPATLKDMPTVVLVNGGSASASEIVAAALKDNGKAYLIGEKTYGKGVVQQLIRLKDDSQLKVTIASWYRPNGKNINHLGIKPDLEAKISDADSDAGNDTQLQAAQAYLNK